eukprot:TRINITY_DN27020_c0_g1_i1.p1 TRINITY_DN27020_c0_g1~~TRINITY_DN27020_c0_g1_i1.p1  ORF type:complete len:402 (-),score=64.74 TRINITY_DN27020_c0_g1_i1:121-1326(-)
MARQYIMTHHFEGTESIATGNNMHRGHQTLSLIERMRRFGTDDAWNALAQMQQRGTTTDKFTISRLLMKTMSNSQGRRNVAEINRSISLVKGFIQIKPQEADEVLFNVLLDACCRLNDASQLEAIVSKMRELDIPPSHVTLGNLIKAYGQAGDVDRVLEVWGEMSEQRRHANAVTFGCLLDACVMCGRTDKAMEVFQDMKRWQKHRNTIFYTTLIKGFGFEKNLESALALFNEMKDDDVPYNIFTYNSIIEVCVKCSDLETAESLLSEMKAPSSNVRPDHITYSTLLKGYCQNGDLDGALEVKNTIDACGLQNDELVYNTLLEGCVKAFDLESGIGVFVEMTRTNMKPSSLTCSILVKLYQQNGYIGDATEGVAELYNYCGLERPSFEFQHGRGAWKRSNM